MNTKNLFVAVRADKGGVHMGILDLQCPIPGFVRLLRARSVWRWEGALGVQGLSVIGPGPGSSISSEHDVWLRIDDICGVHVCTDEARDRLSAVPPSDERMA